MRYAAERACRIVLDRGRCAHGKTPAESGGIATQATRVGRVCDRKLRPHITCNNKRNPATRRWQGFHASIPLSGNHSLGVDGADGLTVHAAAEGTAARACHVRQRRSAAVRAGNGLGGLGLPVCAAGMGIRARGLVLRQCHCVSSISFERLSLSVQYLNVGSVQTSARTMRGRGRPAAFRLFPLIPCLPAWLSALPARRNGCRSRRDGGRDAR